jgi:xylose isomerase
MPVDVAVKNSMDALRAANDRINGLDHAGIVEAVTRPDVHRGWIEAHLIRRRAPHPDRLAPLAEAIRTVGG